MKCSIMLLLVAFALMDGLATAQSPRLPDKAWVLQKDGTLREVKPEPLPGRRQVGGGSDADVSRARAAIEKRDLVSARSALEAIVNRGPEAGFMYADAVRTLALLDASQGRSGEALRRLSAINRSQPTSEGLLLEMEILAADPSAAARAARVGAEFSRALRATAAVDQERARRELRDALSSFADPELLVRLTTAAAVSASRTQPAQELFRGFVGGEVYLESMQNAARATRVAAMAMSQGRWDAAVDALFKATGHAESAKDGYPRQSLVVVPVLCSATAACFALSARMEEAGSLASRAMQRAALPAHRDEARRLIAVLSALRGSRLDRTPAQEREHADDQARSAQAAADAARASLFAHTITNGFSFR